MFLEIKYIFIVPQTKYLLHSVNINCRQHLKYVFKISVLRLWDQAQI